MCPQGGQVSPQADTPEWPETGEFGKDHAPTSESHLARIAATFPVCFGRELCISTGVFLEDVVKQKLQPEKANRGDL